MKALSFRTASHFPLIITFLCIFRCWANSIGGTLDCRDEDGSTSTINIHVITKMNHTGLWTTNFSARKIESSTKVPSNITLDVSHSVIECNGKREVHINGVLADLNNHATYRVREKLLFHPKCGSNVGVTDNGLTLQKINLDIPIYSVAASSRPLKDNEIFEVELTKKHNKFAHSLGIGATTVKPELINNPKHISHIKPSWSMYHSHLYYDEPRVVENYGKDLNTLSVGDRVGVMRSSMGSLHFFVNGVDQGPAASNVPYPVYGMIELWENAAAVKIVESS